MAQATFAITATSQEMKTSKSASTAPQITMNGNPFPQPQGVPSTGTGYQLVVLDATGDLTSPNAIRANQYLYLYDDGGSWMGTYPYLYANILRTILTAGDPETQIVMLASWGLDANMAPTTDALAMFLSLGAGPEIQKWETSVDVGSQSGEWTAYPAAYVLVGNPAYAYGQGEASFSYPQSGPVNAHVEVTLGH